ncbi:hypothetical protein N7470_006725 [Penicillium chermesinum]|nr:hypothetical protein N7470_006725 [Penicillium chermesinum]
MDSTKLREIHDFLLSLAHRAGEIITKALPDSSGTGSKKNSADLVTEYDRAVENMISSSLKIKYPDYLPENPLTDAPTFIVDPIDGTINFVHGFPYSCVSLGFAVNKEPVVGIVYNPFTKTLYSGIQGQGSFLNGDTRLPVKGANPEPLSGLTNALIAIEWGSERGGPNWDTKVRTFAHLGQTRENGGAMVRSMRSTGSAALNMCAVAEGTLDLYWEGGCWEWDVCAAWVILKEAGGIVVDGSPNEWEARLDGRKYLAIRGAPEAGQKELVEQFWSCIQGPLKY